MCGGVVVREHRALWRGGSGVRRGAGCTVQHWMGLGLQGVAPAVRLGSRPGALPDCSGAHRGSCEGARRSELAR